MMMLMGKSVFQAEPYQIQCVHLEDTIGMGYVACRLFDMNNISKQIKSSKPDFVHGTRILGILPGKGFELIHSKGYGKPSEINWKVMQYSWTRLGWMGTFHTLVTVPEQWDWIP